jgi:oligoendopeptidase F
VKQAIGLALLILSTPALAAEPQKSTPMADWDLRPVYADEAAAVSERSAIESDFRGFARWRGQLTDPDAVLGALDYRSALKTRVLRFYNFASMRLARDAGDNAAASDAASAGVLYSKFNASSAYIEPELVALGPDRLSAIAREPRLARHRLTIEQLIKRAEHVLPADQEALVASAGPLQISPATIHDTFTNAELPWPTVTARGEAKRLTLQGFRAAMRDPDRTVRREAWEAFTAVEANFKQTEAALVSAYLAGQAWEAKVRKWPSQTALITASDPVPTSAFASINTEADLAARGALARYAALKSQALHLPVLASYDSNAPFATDTRRYSIEDAKRLTIEAVVPLGPEYRDRLSRGLAGKLMDWRPLPTKAPGATTFYVAPDIPGFVEVSFTGAYDDVAAIAHEWGHWIHWDYSRASNRPIETLAPPVTVGDVPSFVHEMLVVDRQISTAPDRNARIVALTNAIDALRGSYYGVVAQANFELAIRSASDKGEQLDADTLSDAYCAAHQRFGMGAAISDKRECLGWVSEPYVFYDLYFYRYLLATSAAAWFVQHIESGDRPTIARYKTFLAAGGSEPGPNLLKTAGFDTADPSVYHAMTARMDRLVDQLTSELRARSEESAQK